MNVELLSYRQRLRKFWVELIYKDALEPSMSVSRRGERSKDSKTLALLIPSGLRQRIEAQQKVFGLESFARTAQVALRIGIRVMENHDPPPTTREE